MLWTFVPIAALMTIAPGPATAMVVRSALRGGWRAGVSTVAGNAVGVVAWALLSVLGISALVAASEVAFMALKVGGAGVLVWFGVRMLLDRESPVTPLRAGRGAFRDGLITSLANPKLAVFFVALFPQFLDDRAAVLPTALLMAGLIVTFDFAWYTSLAVVVSRAKAAVLRSGAFRWVERAMGAALIALGARLAVAD